MRLSKSKLMCVRWSAGKLDTPAPQLRPRACVRVRGAPDRRSPHFSTITTSHWLPPSPRLPAGSHDWRPLSVRELNNLKNIGSYLTKIGMHNFGITFHISGQLQPQSPYVDVVPDNNVLLSTKILKKTMNYRLCWHHVNTCCCVMCAYYAYVTIHRTLDGTCFEYRHFVNKVSGQTLFSRNQTRSSRMSFPTFLPVHSRGVIWKIKSKSNFPVSFSLISAEMNLVGNYQMLRGLRTVNPEGLQSTSFPTNPVAILLPPGPTPPPPLRF